MLDVWEKISRKISRVERKEDCLFLYSEALTYRLMPKRGNILRVTVTKRDDFLKEKTPGIVLDEVNSDWTFEEQEKCIMLSLEKLQVEIDRETGSFTYKNQQGNLLLQEKNKDSKILEEFTSYKLAEGTQLEKEVIQTADGKKEVIKSADRVEDEMLYHTGLWMNFQEDEALYGLGQQEEGACNLRGKTVYIHQANRKIAVPFLLSSKGYGILMDTYSPMIFSDTQYGSYWYTQASREMDFYFIAGTPTEAIKGYRLLSGKAVMLPKWAFGYLQSQERYETQEEILKIATTYREKKLGLDGVILDWCSWEDGMWGQKSFDQKRFPNPQAMTDCLHDMDVHFMISVWPNMDEHCDNYKEFKEKDLLLPGSNLYNPLDKAGRDLYWSQLERAFYSKGVDAWWCDSSEPITPEWNQNVRPEPATLYAEYCNQLGDRLPYREMNAYSFYHAKSIYEGQRGARLGKAITQESEKENGTFGLEKRVCNLTRSAYTGQQRFGTILWSGDTGASWDTLKKQIGAGLMFCASGLPYWTMDIGAFFVKTGEQWYWDGEYPEALQDLAYQELYVRWFQWGCFLPIFRAHGTDCYREIWQFDQQTKIDGDTTFYDALVQMNQLRYRLMPYIYSTAGAVWREDKSFISHLGIAFPEDLEASKIADEYMFGESILVCPVTVPMYYDCGNQKLENASKIRNIYLPAGQGWYDFWSKDYYEGGQWIQVDAPLYKIPLFVKEGSVIPMTDSLESTVGTPDITIHVYSGRDCSFELYEDAGDGYGYEQGEYCVRKLIWQETTKNFEVVCVTGDEKASYVAKILEEIQII